MSGINALIATAGGPVQPGLDVQSGINDARRNAFIGQQMESQPRRMEMREQEMKLRETALELKAAALEQSSKSSMSMDYPEFTISGRPESIYEVASAVAQYPDQAKGPEFMAYLAQKGVSVKAREQKAQSPITLQDQIKFAGDKAGAEAAAREPYKKGEEFELTTDKEGNVTFRKGMGGGAGGPGGMTKPTQTKIEGKLFDATNSLARLKGIEDSFKPEFLTYKSKLGQQITSWKSKAGMEISPEEKQSRQEFSTFKRRSISNMNQYLNELSGAAITEQEAARLTKALPNPGTGIFDGDDPIDFESKMRDVMEEAKLATVRYNYLLANGWTDQQIVGSIKKGQVQSIGSFKSQIQARGKEIAEELKKSGTYEGDIPGIIKQKLKEEFKL